MESGKKDKDLNINQKELDLLVTNIIPTSRYFEVRFDHLQEQINDLKMGQRDIKLEMDKRFDLVDKRFEQVDKRFEQIDKRFEQVDRRFEQVDKRLDQINAKLDTIIERVDVKIDAGLRENRSLTVKMFSFAMIFSAISMAGLLAKMMGLF